MKMTINQNEHIFVISKSNRLSSDYRRLAKPMMEKRRRARINNSLNELKYLILKALNKDPAGHNKLEKANILEMTVNYLQSISPEHLFYSYQAGYNHCIAQVSMFLSSSSSSSLSSSCKRSLLIHLNNCFNKMRLTSCLSTNTDTNNCTWYKKYSLLSGDLLFNSLQLSINEYNYSQPNLCKSAILSQNLPSYSPTTSLSSSSSSSLLSLSTVSSPVKQWECKESLIWRPW